VLRNDPGCREGAAPEERGQEEFEVDCHGCPCIIKKPASPGETTGAH
jgi:hypothetical protein